MIIKKKDLPKESAYSFVLFTNHHYHLPPKRKYEGGKATSIAINLACRFVWLIVYLYSSLLNFLTGGSEKRLTRPKLCQDSINKKKETHINTNIKTRCQSEGREWCLGFMFKQPSQKEKRGRGRDGMGNKQLVERSRGGGEVERWPITLTNCWVQQKIASVSRFHTQRQTTVLSFN